MDKNEMLIKKAIKKNNLPENKIYKTFDQWRAEGLYVIKGEKALFKVKLWNGLNTKKDFYFFSEDQTDYKEYIKKQLEAEYEAEQIEKLNKQQAELKKDIRRFTRRKAINPGTAANGIADFAAFKKQNFGLVMFSNNSKYYIEDLYSDLHSYWPDVFNSDEITEADLLIDICDSINSIVPVEQKCKNDDSYMGWLDDLFI